jgi:predicted alpha/beta hydrolase
MVREDIRFTTSDGFSLAATVFGPETDARGAVVVAPATGVKRRLYSAFAEFLAQHGWCVLTFDWRGTGDSRPASLRGFQATMRDWALLDLAAALDWAESQSSPVVLFGHSFGGQAVGLVPNVGVAHAIVTVATQSGYWGHYRFPEKLFYAFLWFFVMPVLSRALGYFPSRRFGLGEDLPAGVARQWAAWCRSPRYVGDYAGHRKVRAPMLVIGFTDDPYAPPRALAAMHDEFANAPQERRILTPREVGLERVGHFGFFKNETMWPSVEEWMMRQNENATN